MLTCKVGLYGVQEHCGEMPLDTATAGKEHHWTKQQWLLVHFSSTSHSNLSDVFQLTWKVKK